MHDQGDSGSNMREVQASTKPSPNGTGSGDEMLSLLAGVEAQFQQLRDAQVAQAEEVRSLSERTEELDLRETTLQELARTLEERQVSIERDLVALADEEARVTTELESRTTALQEESRRVEEELAGRRAAAEEQEQTLRAELDERRAALEATGAELQEQRRAIEATAAEQQERESQIEQRKAEIVARIEELTTLQDRMESLEQSTARADALVEELQGVTNERQELQSQLEQITAEHAALAEQMESLQARHEELSDQFQKVTATLADRDQELARSNAELEQARGDLAERDQTIAAHRQELESARSNLELASGKLTEFSKMLAEQGPQMQSGAAALAQVAEQQREIDRLRRQVEAAGGDADGPDVADYESLRAELNEARAVAARVESLVEHVQQLTGSHEMLEQQLQEKVHQERALHKQIEALQHERETAATTTSVAAPDAAAQALRERLHVRSRRLRAIRAAIRVERDAARGEASEQRIAIREISEQQLQIEKVRQRLAAAEKHMRRRWARSRAIVVVASLFVLLGLDAAGAWISADLVNPAQVAASVTIEAEGDSPEEKALVQWHRQHTDMLAEGAFHEIVAQRMANQRNESFQSVTAVAALLDEVSIDVARPGEITLSLSRSDGAEATALLDIIATSMANVSEDRGGAVVAVARGRRGDDGRMQFARTNPLSLGQLQIVRAAPIFGGLVVVTLALVAIFYLQFSSTRRIIHEDVELFPEPESGSNVPVLHPLG